MVIQNTMLILKSGLQNHPHIVSYPVCPLPPPHCPRETWDFDRSITEHANINLWFVAVVVVGVASSVSHNRLEQHSRQAVAVALWLFVVVVTCATPTLSVHRSLATYFHHPGNRERPEHQRILHCHGHPSFVLGSCEAGLWGPTGRVCCTSHSPAIP